MHLQVDNVSKRFGAGAGAKLVLDHISFDLHAGEFLALVGSSGSGKSTVMRLIAGLDRPSAGAITIDGAPVRGPGSDRGMVFQKYSLYPWLTAAQNVAFGMELQRRPRQEIRERTAYFLEVVGLADAAVAQAVDQLACAEVHLGLAAGDLHAGTVGQILLGQDGEPRAADARRHQPLAAVV